MLADISAALSIPEGELEMWQAEPPTAPLHDNNPPAFYVTVKSGKVAHDKKQDRTIGECLIVDANSDEYIYPDAAMSHYMRKVENKNILTKIGKNFVMTEKDAENFSFQLIDFPQHGSVKLNDNGKPIAYSPKSSFEGRDRFTVKVTNGGISVGVIYFVSVQENAHGLKYAYENFCSDIPKKYPWTWKISQPNRPDAPTSYSVSYASGLGSLLSHANQSLTGFQNLAGTAVGNTMGSGLYAQITLDD